MSKLITTLCAGLPLTSSDCSEHQRFIDVRHSGSIVQPMRPITGVVQHYPWGTTDEIPRLLGAAPDGQPWAEYWLGTHPHGPSTCDDGSPLSALAGELPYLLKLLSADRPLSLQAHPNAEQAEQGFAEGYFSDPRPKPELLIAVTEFTALCGVRPIAHTIELLTELGLVQLANRLSSQGAMSVITDLYRSNIDVSSIVKACASSTTNEAQLVVQLNEMYPNEPSAAVALLLNLVHLKPGEAIHLDAGNLHAYISGTGIELMASSNNVVRGGLTSKPIDVDLLLSIIDPTPLERPTLAGVGSFDLKGVGIRISRVNAGEQVTADIHSLAIRDDGIAFYTAPGETINSTIGCWAVLGS